MQIIIALKQSVFIYKVVAFVDCYLKKVKSAFLSGFWCPGDKETLTATEVCVLREKIQES